MWKLIVSKTSLILNNILILIVILIAIFYFEGSSFRFKIHVGDYTYTSWLFNYDYGFMRRALPGYIISELNIDNNYKNIRLISVIIFLFSYFSFSYLFIKSLKKLNLKKGDTYLYFACLMSLPFIIPQWLFLIGKFDYIIQTLVIFCIIMIIKQVNKYLVSSFIVFIIFIGALTHEATLIIFIPLLMFIFYFNYKSIREVIFLSIVTLSSLIFISIFGKIDANQANILIKKYEYSKGFNIYAVRTTVISTFENIIFNFYSFINNKTYVPLFFTFVLFFPILNFLKKIIENRFYKYYIFALSPLLLFIVAFDYYRWISLVFFNIFLLTFYLILSQNLDLKKINSLLLSNKKNIITYSFLCLFLGPLGDSQLFPKFLGNNIGGVSLTNVPNEILVKLNFPENTNNQFFQVNIESQGWHIENDFSTFNNLEKAKLWYEKQANMGNISAQNNLALMLIRGGKFEINHKKSLDLLLSASKKNSAEAFNNLGVMYSNGIGVKKDYERAIFYYKKSESLGSPTAMYNLAISYKIGINNLNKDEDKFIEYLKKSAKLNFAMAEYELRNINK